MHDVISRVDAYPIVYNEPHYRNRERYLTFVRIETRDGAVGWGEANTRFREAALATRTLVEEGYCSMLVGRDPLELERLWDEMCEHSFWFGVEGIAAFAISAIDCALWDLNGILQSKPVWELLGARAEPLSATAAIIFDIDDPEWTVAEFASLAAAGFRTVKGGGGLRQDALIGQDQGADLRLLDAIRAAIGSDVSLIVDVAAVHGLWDERTAVDRINEWEHLDLRWVEQPLLPSDLDAYARLRAAVRTPIGTGEDEWGPESYRHLIASGGVDVVQVDPGRCLGISGCMRVIDQVETAGLRVSAHSWSSAVNTAASLAVLATAGTAETIDFKPHESPVQHEIVATPWAQFDGALELRRRPGLGITMLEPAVMAMRFD